ncbi:MAG: [citrate (pro-3S)-lyase] ligase [Clostridiales Family XIII bacterium]|jgi:[citrate (pro-3S)-lyase] ligase|nr:[citrate (pro-3S)-lyase] ligase [Clostridiales Family XIII bacterium]
MDIVYESREAAQFLASLGLEWDPEVDFTVALFDGGKIAATGSRNRNILKCIGVDPSYRSGGLAATIVSELIKNAWSAGFRHLFIYTSPKSAPLFSGLGFYPIMQTDKVVLLENMRNGIRDYVGKMIPVPESGNVGCIVANCNPFTCGHQYLAEYAAGDCDFLYFFLLSEDKSEFSYNLRLEMVREGLSHLDNVGIYPTGDYLISSATFPDYFLKDKDTVKSAYYDLDIRIFAAYFAKPLKISRRYAGSEPSDAVTRGYNERMGELLPSLGINFIEIPRKTQENQPVSARTVRRLLSEGRLEDVKRLVPASTFERIRSRR